MALSIGAIIGIIFALAILGALGYIVYRYTKDSKVKYNEVKAPPSVAGGTASSGTCTDPTGGQRVSAGKAAFNSTACKVDCDEKSDCMGYEWDSKSCSLFTGAAPIAAVAADGANCYAKAS